MAKNLELPEGEGASFNPSPGPVKVDTLIIGAGVIGSSVAMNLAEQAGAGAGQEIRVIDFDLEGALSSTELNAGGVRATWNQPINIRLSARTIDYLASPVVASEVGYRACGYLWLHTPERLPIALRASRAQTTIAGWPVEAWDVAELRRRAPIIDKVSDLAGAIFSPRDGLVNPNRVKGHFRERARGLGVRFDDRILLKGATALEGGGFRLEALKFPATLSDGLRRSVLSQSQGDQPLEGAVRVEYLAKRVVNCAGPWAAQVAELLGYRSPAFPVRRQICLFDCRDADLSSFGMVVDSSGVYFHPEATSGLAGFANHGEPPGFNFNYDGEEFFMNMIWPALYERATCFEKLKHLSGWAGLYDVSPDESAILGPVVAWENLYEAHSFSGHGVMQSYAAGLALAERMVHGKYLSVDAGELSAARFESGKLLREDWVI